MLSQQPFWPDTQTCPVARVQGNDFRIPPETKHAKPKDDADAFLSFVYRVKAVAAAAEVLSREEAAILCYGH